MTYVCGKPLALCLACHGAVWMCFSLGSLPALLIVLELICVEGPWLPHGAMVLESCMFDSNPPEAEFTYKVSIVTLLHPFFFFFFPFAVPHGMRDPSFPTRDRTCAPCGGSTES